MKNYLLCGFLIFIVLGYACVKPVDDKVRSREKFNSDWRFTRGDPENARLPGFDDSNWRKPDLPHDWAIEGPFNEQVYFQGGFLPYPGVGWYRKTFTLPPGTECCRIEFDGVMRDAKVWLNGDYLGGWAYGYTSFSFDVSKQIKHDQQNVIAVRVKNEDFSSRWYPGSGIYRNVWLTITNPVHVEHWGTYITTPDVTDKSATVKITTWVQNQGPRQEDITLETTVYDIDGKAVAVTNSTGGIAPDKSLKIEQTMTVKDPQRWDIDNPYLYKAVNKVKVNGELVDFYETPFGIRTFRFDPDKGFFLNGRNIKIKGVNLHHDLGPLGAAVSYRATERQLRIMKDMGANAIRTAHNPPSPELLDLCDKLGLLVMDEAFDEWRQPKWNVKNSYNLLFDEWAEKDTRAMIKRDRNHPSIILWSTGNEVPELGTKDGKKSARMLADICREMDPTRPVSSGIHLSIPIDRELLDIFDVAGFNYFHESIEDLHKKFPDKPFLVTESAAVLSSRGVYQFPVKRIYKGYKPESVQISSYDLINTGFGALPDVEFELQENNPWLAGEFVWAGFDYHGEPDPFEDMWPAHSSYFGIVDMCGFPKDRYYLYTSHWTDEPMIHVLPHWNWQGRVGEKTPVHCYTNCASAELFVNGESYGKKTKRAGEYRLIWNDINYQPGAIKVTGYDENGNSLCDKEIKTAGEPFRIALKSDRDPVNADSEDLAFVTVKITDAEGTLCPASDHTVSFQIEGEGRIAAVGNGDPTSIESYGADHRKVFHGLCLVIVWSTGKAGEIRLRAFSPGLNSAEIVIKSVK